MASNLARDVAIAQRRRSALPAVAATPLTVVCWKWAPAPGYRSQFTAEHVNVLRRMVARNYPKPHRFVCITDDAAGLDPEVDVVDLWDDFGDLVSPHGARNPSCYRRLKAFGPEMAQVLGPRFVWLDLDCVITGDLRPLFERREPFLSWGDTNPRNSVNGSMIMMDAGARAEVLEKFDPKTSPDLTRRIGLFGSDQAWISYVLGDREARWGCRDGVYSYRVHLRPQRGILPSNARIVFFHGQVDPWSDEAQRLDWVREHWR
jgi:hypothetical protein